MAESSEGANLANTIRGLKKFDRRNPAEFKTWMKKLCVVISVTRRDILPLLKETARPTHTSNIAEYNRANEDLYAMLFLLVELPASLCVQKHENGDGQAAFKELCNTYDKVTDEVIRATMEDLVNTPMEPGQNPDDYFNQKRLLRIRAEKMGEHISDRYFKGICVTGFTDNYKDVKMMMYRDPSFDVDQMQTTMQHMFLDEQSRNETKGRIAGRGSVMTAVTSEQDIICYWYKNHGHSKKDCPKFKSRTKPAGAAKWCSVHRATTHRNEECYSQGATRPTKNASVSLACINCRHCTSADSKEPTVDNTEPSHSDKPVINFAGSSDDFDGGFMYAAGMPGRFTPSAKDATLLVDSGASESFLDDELIPDLKTRMREFKTLSTPREITTAGKHTLHGIGSGIISFTIRDNHGTQLPVNMRALVVPGLGRNIFAPAAELRNGVRFVLEKKTYLTIRGTVIPLNQDPRDQGVCSLDIMFQRDSSLLEEDLFTPNCDLSSAELEGQVQRLRQEVRRLSKINAAQSLSPSSTPTSPGVAVDQRDAGTREPEPASPSVNQEPENEDEHGPPSPAAPVTGPSLRIRSDGRPFQVTRASTRRSPSSKDTEYPGALHTLFSTYDHDPRALTSRQLLHIATQTTPSMLTTADSAHLDGQPFDTPRAFVYATGVPVHKGFSKEGQLVRIPNSYKDAQKSPQWGDWNNAIQKEMDSLRKHNVYKLVKMSSVPKEGNIIGSRFVFKQKVDGRFKARLVVQGYVQELSSEQPEDKLLGAQGIKLYQSITGSLLYIAQCTRYDLCYAVNQLTKACNRPAEVHMTAAKHVLRYLRGTPDLPITYRKGQLRLVSYTDASFGANPDNRKSTTGYLFFLGGAPISFGSKIQSLTTQSTVESELQALSYGAREAVYLSNFLTELGLKDSSQVPIRSDSTGALSVAGNSMFRARTKHIALRYFFVRELVKRTRSPFTTRRPSRCSRTSQPSTCPSTPSVISFNRYKISRLERLRSCFFEAVV